MRALVQAKGLDHGPALPHRDAGRDVGAVQVVEGQAGFVKLLQRGNLVFSFPSREPPDALHSPRATQDVKPEGEAESLELSLCLSPSQPSEIGYLNVASPGDTGASQLQELSQSVSSQNF